MLDSEHRLLFLLSLLLSHPTFLSSSSSTPPSDPKAAPPSDPTPAPPSDPLPAPPSDPLPAPPSDLTPATPSDPSPAPPSDPSPAPPPDPSPAPPPDPTPAPPSDPTPATPSDPSPVTPPDPSPAPPSDPTPATPSDPSPARPPDPSPAPPSDPTPATPSDPSPVTPPDPSPAPPSDPTPETPSDPTPAPPSDPSPAPPPDPTPAPWPEQFHSVLSMNFNGALSLIDLWYDWPNGRNLNIIQEQLGGPPLYDLEWNNGTSFIYTLPNATPHSCRSLHVPVGILRPNWLDGATYIGRASVDGFLCNVWEKADFIRYYEDVATRRPVSWIFYTGRTAHVMTFEVGAAMEDGEWQAPAYCFANGTAETLEDIDDAGDFEAVEDVVVLRRSLRA